MGCCYSRNKNDAKDEPKEPNMGLSNSTETPFPQSNANSENYIIK